MRNADEKNIGTIEEIHAHRGPVFAVTQTDQLPVAVEDSSDSAP